MNFILAEYGISRHNVLAVGDILESDILMGKAVGCDTCLMLGGVSTEADLAKVPKDLAPTFLARGVEDLIPVLGIGGEACSGT